MSIDSLRPDIRQLAQTAEEHAYSWMLSYEPSAEDLLNDIPEMLNAYVQTAALLAADWYNSQDAESSYHAAPVELLADERVGNLAQWVYRGPQRPENRMRVAAHKIVFDAVRSTVQQNAQQEGVAVVRYEYAGSCGDCVARATTVARESNSRSDDLATDFHASCEGLLVPVRSGVWEPPGYAREWHHRVAAARRAGNTNPDDIAKWLAAN